MRHALALLAFLLLLVACSGGGGDEADDDDEELFPDVVAAEVEVRSGGAYRVSATLISSYDSADRYADAWRVMAPDGTVLGVRELAHHHQAEQPFTRSLDGVEIPADVKEVTVEGRDQISGWGGETSTAPVPEAAN